MHWPDLVGLIRAELGAYLVDAERPELRTASTGCADWSGDELTAHLAATFQRFSTLLVRGRTGDLAPPFDIDGLSAENARAVAGFTGDPVMELTRAVEGFCDEVDDPAEIMPHQFGPIPVGLQEAFGLNELVIHHDDLLASTPRRYRPRREVVDALVPAWAGPLSHPDVRSAEDPWTAILIASGRPAET